MAEPVTHVETKRASDGSVKALLVEDNTVIAQYVFSASEAAAWSDAEALEKACDWAEVIILDRSPNLTFEEALQKMKRFKYVKQEM